MVARQESLAKKLVVITLPHGEIEIEDAIRSLREMSETFKKTKWDPRQIRARDYVVEFPNDNALNYLLSKTHWQHKDGKSYITIKR